MRIKRKWRPNSVGEQVNMPALDWPLHNAELRKLEQDLESAFDSSPLGEERDLDAADKLLIEMRLASIR